MKSSIIALPLVAALASGCSWSPKLDGIEACYNDVQAVGHANAKPPKDESIPFLDGYQECMDEFENRDPRLPPLTSAKDMDAYYFESLRTSRAIADAGRRMRSASYTIQSDAIDIRYSRARRALRAR